MNNDTIIRITNALHLNALVGCLESAANALETYTDPEIQELSEKLHVLAVKKQHEADAETNIALALNPEVDIWQVRDSL